MAFLDETGLAELWALVKAEDAKGAKTAKTSYVGTGTYGSSAPNTLTFDFEPIAVTIVPAVYSGGYGLNTYSNSYYVGRYGDAKLELFKDANPKIVVEGDGNSMSDYTLPVTFNGNTVQWYVDGFYSGVQDKKGPVAQLNVSGTTYHVIAFGK